LHSLDAGADPKAQEQTVKMRLDGAARHVELTGDFVVVAALK